MKILAVERMPHEWRDAAQAALLSDETASPLSLPVTLIADSALVRPGNPVFLPDFAVGWTVHIVPYFTIGRLGKTIPSRFVPRYIDGMGLAARLLPQGEVCDAPCWALGANFDGALAYGPKFPVENPDEDITLSIAGNELSLNARSLRLNDTVALISRYMMLKTGDMILPCDTALQLPAQIGLCESAALNGREALLLKIK